MVTCRGDAGCLSIMAFGVGTMWSGREVPRSPALWAGLVRDCSMESESGALLDLTRGILRAGLR